MSCQVLVPAGFVLGVQWVGLSSCLVSKREDVLSTDRLTQEVFTSKCLTPFSTGEENSCFLSLR